MNNPNQTEPCPTGAIACYKYNALGQFVELNWRSANRVRNFVYSPSGQELGQYTSSGYTAWDDQYVPLGSRQIAKYYGCCDTMFVHPNHLGSTTMITNAAGTVMRDLVFYPYGQTWRNIGNNWDLHFAGMWQREFASGLDPTPNRLYHSRLFRWMTPDEFTGGPVSAYGPPDPTPSSALPYADILNPQSLNKYQYAYNNPMRYIDPTGRAPWDNWGWVKRLRGRYTMPPPPPPITPPEAPKHAIAVLKTDMAGTTTTFIAGSTGSKDVTIVQIETRVDVTKNAKPGADAPFTSYVKGVSNRHAGEKAYGPEGAFIDVGDSRGRQLHGGGSGLEDPLAPRQGWKPTLGCTRGQNEDVIEVGEAVTSFRTANPGAYILYVRE